MRISDWSSDVCSSDLLRPNVKVDFEEYAPTQTADFTASAQRMFDALKDKKGRKIISIIWAGPHPLPKIADLKPERYGIEIAPGGNRSEERRVGKECVSTCRSRWSPYH